MSTMTPEPSTARSGEEGVASRLLVPEMWATVCIVAMWLAVLFVGLYGGDMIFNDASTGVTVIPSVVAVALFAALGTGSVAKRVFGRDRVD
jgi:hypothetical protein